MKLRERIIEKIIQLEKAHKELAHIVILGREEYYEYLTDPRGIYEYFLHLHSRDEWIMGMRITRSRRLRYLAVLPKRLSRKIGWYTKWNHYNLTGDDKALIGITIV